MNQREHKAFGFGFCVLLSMYCDCMVVFVSDGVSVHHSQMAAVVDVVDVYRGLGLLIFRI